MSVTSEESLRPEEQDVGASEADPLAWVDQDDPRRTRFPEEWTLVRLLALLSLGYLAYQFRRAWRRDPENRTDERRQSRERGSDARAGRKAVEAEFEEIPAPARREDGRP